MEECRTTKLGIVFWYDTKIFNEKGFKTIIDWNGYDTNNNDGVIEGIEWYANDDEDVIK